MKILSGLVIFIVIVLSLWVAYNKNQTALVGQKQLEHEIYSKLLAEEGLKKSHQKITALESSLRKSQKKVESTKATLEQTVDLNSKLKGQLDIAIKVQKQLEEQISALEKLAVKEEVVAVAQ